MTVRESDGELFVQIEGCGTSLRRVYDDSLDSRPWHIGPDSGLDGHSFTPMNSFYVFVGASANNASKITGACRPDASHALRGFEWLFVAPQANATLKVHGNLHGSVWRLNWRSSSSDKLATRAARDPSLSLSTGRLMMSFRSSPAI